MDLPKAPTQDDVHAASGIWNWIVFFVGLVVSGGAVEYMLTSRYVTKKELERRQLACTQHIEDQIKLAIMKNNEEMEKRMVSALTEEIRNGFREMGK